MKKYVLGLLLCSISLMGMQEAPSKKFNLTEFLVTIKWHERFARLSPECRARIEQESADYAKNMSDSLRLFENEALALCGLGMLWAFEGAHMERTREELVLNKWLFDRVERNRLEENFQRAQADYIAGLNRVDATRAGLQNEFAQIEQHFLVDNPDQM